MKRFDMTMIIGIGLIMVGAMFMLQTFGIVEGVLPLLWILVFVASEFGREAKLEDSLDIEVSSKYVEKISGKISDGTFVIL